MLSSAIVNPHMIVYDLTVLALPLIWFGSYMQEPPRRDDARPYWTTVYWLFALTFMPTAAVIGLQASVFVMVGLLVLVSRAIQADAITHAPATIDNQIAASAGVLLRRPG